MNKQMLKIAGTQVAVQAARRRVDIGLGFALLRDRRIALTHKALALLLGVGGMLLIQTLEIPLEVLTVIFASPIGLEDDIEAVVLPILLACAVLPHLATKEVVEKIRQGRLLL